MSKMFQVYGIGQALIPVLPPPLPFENPPTNNQTNYEIGQVVYSPPRSPTAFYFYGGAGNWIQLANGAIDVTTLTGNTGGAISPSAGNINIVGTGSVSVAGSGSTPTISATASPTLTWNAAPAGVAMLTNNGYVSTAGSAQTFTMPSVAAFGDQLGMIVNGAGAVTIQVAGTGQTIRINNGVQGATGKFTSSNQGASLLFICVVASSSATTGTWIALSSEGTWTPS